MSKRNPALNSQPAERMPWAAGWAESDWEFGSGDESTATVGAHEILLLQLFGPTRESRPSVDEAELVSWLLLYPSPQGPRMAGPADADAIRYAIRHGWHHKDAQGPAWKAVARAFSPIQADHGHALRSRMLPDDLRDMLIVDIAAAGPSAQRAVARKRTTSPEMLDRLAQSVDRETRELVARHPNAGPTTVERLAGDRSTRVRSIVANR